MRPITFTKMQGLGNDFIVVEGPIDLSHAEVQELCDRRFGVGADGVLMVSRGDSVRMEYWNADGSAAEMCGNGLRCIARYAYDRGWTPDRNFSVDTPVGARGVKVLNGLVEAELGRAVLGEGRSIEGGDYHLVDIGNPHAVTFVDDPSSVDVARIGSRLQSEFPDGVNVEFARAGDGRVELRVWERGVGETMACGTGMAAVAAVAHQKLGMPSPVEVSVRGGEATITLREGVAWITGPAEYSFRGSVGER